MGSRLGCSSLERGEVRPDRVSGVARSETVALSVPGDEGSSIGL